MARRSAQIAQQVQPIVDAVKTDMLNFIEDIKKGVESIEQKAEAAKITTEDCSKKAEVALDSATTIANSLEPSQTKCEYKLSTPQKSDSEVLLNVLKNQATSSSTRPSTGFKDAVKSFLDN